MRKRFWLIVLIPLVIIIAVAYFFHNRWIESGIEYAAEEVVGAKVEIENLHLSILPLGIEWTKIEVASPFNPWKNLFETGSVKFSMDLNQLLRNKFIVEELTVDNLIIDTKRKTDGSIDPERKKRAILAGEKITFSKLADGALKNMITTTPLFDIVKLKKGFNADSLVKALDMKTVKHIDTLKKEIDALNNQWSSIQTDFESQKQKVLEIENQVTAIKTSELNNIQSITSAIVTADNAINTVNGIAKLVEERSSSIKNNVQNLTASAGLINVYVKDDFNKLKNMARLPSINTNGMAQLLVGSEMYKRAQNYLHMADAARANVKQYESKPEFEAPPRMVGQDIKFPIEKSYPKFWIKKISITGGTAVNSADGFIRAKGTAANITDNQKLTGSPLTISLEGTENRTRTLKLTGLMDRRTKIPTDEFSAALSGVPISDFSLGKTDFLPTKVSSATMATELRIKMPGKSFDANATFNLQNVILSFEAEPKNTVEQLVREVLIGINKFKVGFRLWNTGGSFDIALSTDLDEILTKRISAVLGAEFEKLQNELKNKFDMMVREQVQKFDKLYKAKLAEVQQELNGYQTLFADKLNIVENKKLELTAQLENEKKGFLENKLKGLFK